MEGIWKARRHSALGLDGVDDRVVLSSSSSLDTHSAMTYEAWVKVLGFPESYPYVIGNDSHAFYAIRVNHSTGFIYFEWGEDPWDGTQWKACQGPTIDDGKWHHFVATYDGTVIKVYHNGSFYNQRTPGSALKSGAHPVFVGGYGTIYNLYGFVASARIYNRALSEAEVKYLYYNPDDPLDTDHLVLWLHPGSIDADAGYWWDISGRDNHGQIFGATKVSLVSPEVTVL